MSWQTAGEYGGSGTSLWASVRDALDGIVSYAAEHPGQLAAVVLGLVMIGALVLRGRRR